jgi:hypothetical protein
VAFISFTGMLTSPNEMAPFQMDLTVHPLRMQGTHTSDFM